MSALAVVEKTPTDRIDYDVDFTRWLTDGDQVIAAIADLEDPTSVTFAVDRVDFSTEVVKVWVSGGADGDEGDIFAEATTQAGRVKRACFTMRIKDC